MIILLGGPGTGKSTQGQLLVDRGKFRWISMGEIIRQKATEQQREEILKGKLLDSQETIKLLELELKELGDNPELILDGFPRYLDQAEWLLEQSRAHKIKISAVVNLFADKEVVKKRLMSRGRQDDSEEVISHRFDVYEQTSLPAIDVLKAGGIPTIQINADQTPEAILNDIVLSLKKINIEA
jgi:adenylate kinase